MRRNGVLCFAFFFVLIFACCKSFVFAEEARSTEFEYLSFISCLGDDFDITDPYNDQRIHNIKLIDEESHIYYVENTLGYMGNKVRFSGSLVSPTARIVSVADAINSFEGNGLPELEVDYSIGYRRYEGQSYKKNNLCERNVIQNGNVFTTSSESLIQSRPNYYYITVKDGDLMTTHVILVDNYQYSIGSSTINLTNDKDIILYDGTNGKTEKLDDELQLVQKNKLPSCINGIQVVGDPKYEDSDFIESAIMGKKEVCSVPADMKSLRIRRSSNDSMNENGFAFAEDFDCVPRGGDAETGGAWRNSYWFYKNRTYAVKINDGRWREVDDDCISPELPLKQGWNIIMVANSSVDWLNSAARLQIVGANWPWKNPRIILLYRESEEEYTPSKKDDTEIENFEVYKAISAWRNGFSQYQKYNVYEKDGVSGEQENWIDLYSSSPSIWMKVITDDQEAETEIEGAELLHGGYLLTLDPETQDSIPIKVTSAQGNTVIKILHINWIMSSTELQKLFPAKGGSFTKGYDKETSLYFLKKEGGEIRLDYQSSPNVTTEVYVEREKKETIEDDSLHSVTVPDSCHRIQFRIIAGNGDEKTYIVVIEREDAGVSPATSERAGSMVSKMLAGGLAKEAKEKQPLDGHWGTFKIASLGEEYLEGTLAGDITKYNYTQATSYAAAILQLVMSGENPYNYLGVNYVEQLAKLGPGYYGPYANNIWTLLAFNAAGYPVDKSLVDQVAEQVNDTTFDLDMRGWGLCALPFHMDQKGVKEKVDLAVETIKQVQLAKPTQKQGYEVTGAFENFWYTNQNIQSHACIVSGLTATGIDVGADEWKVNGLNGQVDGVSLFESYQTDSGKFIRTPDELNEGDSFNKDAVIALGDLYNGSNVWQRYALSNKRYNALLEEAESLLSGQIDDIELKRQLQDAYSEAEQYRSGPDSNEINEHGTEYFTLQEAVFAANGKKPDVFQGNAEERRQVRETIGKIDVIPAVASLTYADRSIVLSAEEAFEALNGDERLEHYVTNRRALEKAYAYIHGIDVFLDAMKEIKKVDLSKAAKVKAAREAYDLLEDRQKAEDAVASKYADLLAAEEIIEACRTADNVVAVIDTLGQITTLDSRESIEGARASYDALDETQKAYVTNYDHLVKAEKELQRLETLEEAKAQAAEVDRLISRIGTVNHNSGTIIQTAEESYQALDQDEAQRLVGGYAYLQETRRIYDNLIWEEERSYTASQVDYTISRIEDAFIDGALEITAENEATVRKAVNAARDQYDAILNGEDPETVFYITGYAYLLHTEAMLQVYDWQQSGVEFTVQDFKDKVLLIPVSPGLESEGDVLIASAMYDALSEEGLLDEESEELYQELSSRLDELEYLQSNYERIQELEEKVLSLGTIGTGSGTDIQEATDIYKSMDPTLQAYVDPSLVDTLEKAADIFDTLGKDKEATDRVVDLIDSIKEADLDSEDKVQEAREAYDALEAKTGVSNYLVLVNTEYRILELKKEEEEFPIASTVIERIKGLGRVQLDDEYKVVSAREAYEALTVTQKKCVKNLADLEEAENRIEALKTATVSLSFQNKKIHEGETVKVKANTSVIDAALTWKISDSSIISFDKKTGMLTGLKAGNASLTAILDNGNQAACHVEITKAAHTETGKGDNLVLNRKKVTLYTKGSGRTVTLALTYNGKKISGKQVTWKSNKPSIARISSTGKITAKKKGTAKITASYKGKKVACKVVVKNPTLKLNKRKLRLSLKKKRSFVLKAIANGKKVSGKKVKWKSSNRKFVVISRNGKVMAKKRGKAKITAIINGRKAFVIVVVK